MHSNIINFSAEKEKREKARLKLLMPTKNLCDYLSFKQTHREVQRARVLVAKGN